MIVQFGKVAMLVELAEQVVPRKRALSALDTQVIDVDPRWNTCDVLDLAGSIRAEQAFPNLDPRWLTCKVVDLAKAIRAEQAFDRMPILADALMDAGCDNDEIIHHCQRKGPHVETCWVLELLLGSDSPTPTRSISLGSKPPHEAISDPNRYIQIIRAKLGAEVGSAKLIILGGRVYCTYAGLRGAEYAVACRDRGPMRWDDAQRMPDPPASSHARRAASGQSQRCPPRRYRPS